MGAYVLLIVIRILVFLLCYASAVEVLEDILMLALLGWG